MKASHSSPTIALANPKETRKVARRVRKKKDGRNSERATRYFPVDALDVPSRYKNNQTFEKVGRGNSSTGSETTFYGTDLGLFASSSGQLITFDDYALICT